MHRSKSAKQPYWDDRDLGDRWQLPSCEAACLYQGRGGRQQQALQAAVLSCSGSSFHTNHAGKLNRKLQERVCFTKSPLSEVILVFKKKKKKQIKPQMPEEQMPAPELQQAAIPPSAYLEDMSGILSEATAQLRVSFLMTFPGAPVVAHPTDDLCWITWQHLPTQVQPASRSYTTWCERPETWCLKGIHSLLQVIRRKCHLSGKQISCFLLGLSLPAKCPPVPPGHTAEKANCPLPVKA